MDARTVRVYERQAESWVAARAPQPWATRRLSRLVARLPEGALVADLGSGPGWYAARMLRRGLRAVALDVSDAMLREAGRRTPELPRVRGDLAALPFARESLAAAWAVNCYMHLPAEQLPVALAHLHASVAAGGWAELTLPWLDPLQARPAELARGVGQRRRQDDRFPGRLFTAFAPARIRTMFAGAGFDEIEITRVSGKFWQWVRARRARSLPDYVKPGLRVLVSGLNPSVYAADTGIPFGRPGNRFWASAQLAGLTRVDRDPFAALADGIGFSDIVKRATRAASELRREEYAEGLQRLEDTVRCHEPGVVCFAGLEGWRKAADSKAVAGPIAAGFAGRPAYLMPSPSGRNAHTSPAELARHLRQALEIAEAKRRP